MLVLIFTEYFRHLIFFSKVLHVLKELCCRFTLTNIVFTEVIGLGNSIFSSLTSRSVTWVLFLVKLSFILTGIYCYIPIDENG